MSSTQKHIYVAYTGGTIGMKPSKQGFIPAPDYLTHTLQAMPEFHRKEMPRFTIHEYDRLMDSSDMHPQDWQLIADDISANYSKYDGFIILHGTDTMAYTASALSFMLDNLSKPVIVTGSQIPLAELRSDGQTNLLNALYIAAYYPINEVTLFFNNKLYRGNRSRKVDADGFDAFDSPNFPCLLEAGINIELNFPNLVNSADLDTASHTALVVNQVVAQPIGMLSLYPGVSAEVVRNIIQQPVKALILLSYGVGNAPQNKALLNELKIAQEKGVVVINCTQCYRGKVNMKGYANGHALFDTGLISGGDMTPEATLAKLHVLLSQEKLSTNEVKRLMTQDLKGERSAD